MWSKAVNMDANAIISLAGFNAFYHCHGALDG